MIEKLRSYWFEKQGLYGMAGTASDVLKRSGWARSVGGSNPYLTLFSRAAIRKEDAEAAARDRQIHELPCARGCTHYVPEDEFALALKVGQGTSEVATLNTAKKWLGFTDRDLEELNDHILRAIQSKGMTPKELRESLGDKVKNFGDEGKKRGQTTSLSIGLGYLQAHGLVRRVAVNQRLDTEHYAYQIWNPSPLDGFALSREEALTELARRYFTWIGPATLANFQWFAGLGVNAAKAAIEPLELETMDGGLLISPGERPAFEQHQVPKEPAYALVSSIDSYILHRRDSGSLLGAEDAARPGVFGSGLRDLESNAILDRGRIIGLWEYDPESQTIVALLFTESNQDVRASIAKTEAFIRDELGDARSFSLDSPKSRAPKIAALRNA